MVRCEETLLELLILHAYPVIENWASYVQECSEYAIEGVTHRVIVSIQQSILAELGKECIALALFADEDAGGCPLQASPSVCRWICGHAVGEWIIWWLLEVLGWVSKRLCK